MGGTIVNIAIIFFRLIWKLSKVGVLSY